MSFAVLSYLGVDFALILTLAVFALNFIPNIGFFLAVIAQGTMALLQSDTLTPALIIVVVHGTGDAIIGNIVQPRMQGKSLNLSTFVVMVTLTFRGMIWGGIGAFIALPLTVVIMIVCAQIPGLKPFARLLSSDGILPGEHPPAPETDGTPEETGQTSDIETELAAMKQELLHQKTSRRPGAQDKTAPVVEADTTPPETPDRERISRSRSPPPADARFQPATARASISCCPYSSTPRQSRAPEASKGIRSDLRQGP